MGITILSHKVSVDALLHSNTTSVTKIKAHPITATYAAGFEQFQVKLLAVHAKEVELACGIHEANARVSISSARINDLIDIVSRAVQNATKGDRTAPLQALYFDGKRASVIKKPLLGPKLERVRDWVVLLGASPIAALSALSGEAAAVVAEADAASKALTEAKRKNKAFRTVGERRELIDEFNGLRKSVYGFISELPHKHPEMNLPGSFAERFFSHESAKKAAEPEVVTSKGFADLISEAEAQLAELKKCYQGALAEEAEAAKVKAAAEAARAALVDAKKAATEANARVAALEAELETTT